MLVFLTFLSVHSSLKGEGREEGDLRQDVGICAETRQSHRHQSREGQDHGSGHFKIFYI